MAFVTLCLRNQQFTWFIFLFFGSKLSGCKQNLEAVACRWVQLHSRFQWTQLLGNGGRARQICHWGSHCSLTLLASLTLPCMRVSIKLYDSGVQYCFGAMEESWTVLFELWNKTHLIFYWPMSINRLLIPI